MTQQDFVNGETRAAVAPTTTPPKMVPITRDFLRQFYAAYPDPVLSTSFSDARERVKQVFELPAIEPAPHRMDECMYAARCACEEAELKGIGELLEEFQDSQREHVSAMVRRFLPDDFRGWIFETARAQSEARNKAALDELVNSGASVQQKYELLWKQQWARRETLSLVGNATGVWKLVVRYIAGVPQPLIDFAKQINTPDGPTEELRIKFGPTLQLIVELARELRALKLALDNGQVENSEIAEMALRDAADVLRCETEKFCLLLTKVVRESPFFVSPQDIEKLKKDNAAKK